MKSRAKVLEVRFFKSDAGKMPVREWLKGLSQDDKKIIGEDLKTVEFGWPLGMPVVRKMEKDLWELRSQLADKRTAPILLTVYETFIALLHGFIKKVGMQFTQQTTRCRGSLIRGYKGKYYNR